MQAKRIAKYDGLYGEKYAQPLKDYIFSELIETRSKGFDWSIQSHIHTHLFQLFCIEAGHLEFRGDYHTQVLHAPCILVIPPNVLHGFVYSPDVSGRILTLSDTVVETCLQNLPAVFLAMSSLQCISFAEDSLHLFEAIIRQIHQINDELFADRQEKRAMLNIHFSQLFLSLYRLALQEKEKVVVEEATLKYFRQFQKNIRNSEYPKSMPEFAEELAITTVHLNRICQAVAGKPSSVLVKEYVIEQAKKYLLHTSYSVAEITYLMKFEYPNYFAKQFKKYVGVSPTEFREQRLTKNI